MIVSFCPGRIRLRFAELKKKETAETVLARVREIAGVTKAEVNTVSGSILVEYDTDMLPAEKLVEMGRAELARFGLTLELPELPQIP